MTLHVATVRVTLLNRKGAEFEVDGIYWGDGTVRVDNPRPERYPEFKFLYTEPDIFYEEDPKRLFWLADEDSGVGDLSPFRLKLMFVKIKPARKRGKVSK